MKKARSRRTVILPATLYGPPPITPDRFEKIKKLVKGIKEAAVKKGKPESKDKPDNT